MGLKEKIKKIFVNAGINAIPDCDDDYLKTIQDEVLHAVIQVSKTFPRIGDLSKPDYENEYKGIEEWISKVEEWFKINFRIEEEKDLEK